MSGINTDRIITIELCDLPVKLKVWPKEINGPFVEIRDDADNNAEAKYQLFEWTTYIYKFEGDYNFDDRCTHGIVKHIEYDHDYHQTRGEINTKGYVGTIVLGIVDKDNKHVSSVSFEVCSLKMDYRTDYHQMLEDITHDYTELVMQLGAPATQCMVINDNTNATTLYQRFAFMRSIIESEMFCDAIHRIIASPVHKWQETISERRICNVKRIGRKEVRQMVAATDRVSCDLYLPHALHGSLPSRIMVSDKCDTINNAENQFVKYVLFFFNSFCEDLRSKVCKNHSNFKSNLEKSSVERLKLEIDCATRCIDSYLNTNLFKEIDLPSHLNLNSPVLQRKEGYREVLQAWVFFELAAKLSWNGGEIVYEAGKRNVAVLYEYWCFFKLLEVVKDVFGECDISELVHTDDNPISLNLKQGKKTKISNGNCDINYALYYNRTFCRIRSDSIGEENEYLSSERAGSWSVQMRPDFTLSIWPLGMKESEAEIHGVIEHIHFDAKYRVDNIFKKKDVELIADDKNAPDAWDESDSDVLADENDAEIVSVYKNGDILKMHAYRDAIRHTVGAYVLYPGDINTILREFHEIIPGIGAFSLKPGSDTKCLVRLKDFLKQVRKFFVDRYVVSR